MSHVVTCLQDVKDNHEEAAKVAPQTLQLCQMVSSRCCRAGSVRCMILPCMHLQAVSGQQMDGATHPAALSDGEQQCLQADNLLICVAICRFCCVWLGCRCCCCCSCCSIELVLLMAKCLQRLHFKSAFALFASMAGCRGIIQSRCDSCCDSSSTPFL